MPGESTEKTEITGQTEIGRVFPFNFRLFRYFRLFRTLFLPLSDFRRQAVFGFQSPRVAPVGSVIILIQPASGTSVTSRTILAPSDFAFSVAALMSFTSTYASHVDGSPGIGCFIIPPPVPVPGLIIV